MTGSSASVASINHNACYHKLHTVSNTIIVLVFSEMTSLVRMILQREENKGVEFTVYRGNGLHGNQLIWRMFGRGTSSMTTVLAISARLWLARRNSTHYKRAPLWSRF